MAKKATKNKMPKVALEQNEKEFFNKLLKLCQEYNVTFQSDSLFFKGNNGLDSVYTWVEVHGAWAIKKEYEALIAEKENTPSTVTKHIIYGDK